MLSRTPESVTMVSCSFLSFPPPRCPQIARGRRSFFQESRILPFLPVWRLSPRVPSWWGQGRRYPVPAQNASITAFFTLLPACPMPPVPNYGHSPELLAAQWLDSNLLGLSYYASHIPESASCFFPAVRWRGRSNLNFTCNSICIIRLYFLFYSHMIFFWQRFYRSWYCQNFSDLISWTNRVTWEGGVRPASRFSFTKACCPWEILSSEWWKS